ncbi:hypothetical protein PILCRDRAFT_602444 [Piloderma croceum F 1598]|uniref:Uncharacterized protein n=1 Tax=Piloderma croceum (strain F 1598) TaxID=765440 RepID=A0A0C3BL45_PILCF|nr:hypothetical protein PILCRDRAFT_602444 [Piloderma croceum F 1598]
MGIALFIYIRNTRNKVQVHPNPEVKPFVSSGGQDSGSQMQSHTSLLHTAPSTLNTTYVTPSDASVQPSTYPQYPVTLDSFDRTPSTISRTKSVTTQFITDTSTIYPPSSPVSHIPSAETRMTVESSPSVTRSSSPSSPVPGPGGQLAVEQLVTLQTLYNLNMPAAEIAGVMDRMRFEQQQVTEDGSRSEFARGNAMRDPPSYDIPTSRTLGGVESARVEQQTSGEDSSGLVRGDTKPDPPMYDFKDA